MVCLHLSPGRPMFQHRIENRQQLPHAGGERHLLRFPRSLQALIEDSDHRIEPGCHDRIHIEDRTHVRPSPQTIRIPRSARCRD